MLALLSDPAAWISLLTLSVLEIVLGIDNVIFLTIVAGRLPAEQRPRARQIGLAMALIFRVALLASLSWIIGLTQPLVTWGDHGVSWRDLVLIGGGLFLLFKATSEIHAMLEGEHEEGEQSGKASMGFAAAVAQIAMLDVVFSLDSVITAIGMASHLPVMIGAVVVAIGVMLLAADGVGRFVEAHPTVKMLALAFLLVVGMALVADGLHFHVPRGYIYFAMAFSAAVEGLNLWAATARKRRAAKKG
jgi:predicted tellurium resistance membrane protein TerC